MNKIFEYKTTVTIGDTNALQNMYFLNFFKLQGIVRELFVKKRIKNSLQDLANGMVLITKDARCNYYKDFFLFDDITVKLNFTKIGKTNTRLNFQYFNSKTKELHANGSQTIVFADHQHKVMKIPDHWRDAINLHFIEK
jgi:acyl-CoA thioesterase FadM